MERWIGTWTDRSIDRSMDNSSDQQACGQFALKATAEGLSYVELGLKDKSVGRQWYRMCNRMITDLNLRCAM